MSRQEELGHGAGTEDRKHERSGVRSVGGNLPTERETGERNQRVREGSGTEGKKDGGKPLSQTQEKRDTRGQRGREEEMRTEAEVKRGQERSSPGSVSW